MSTVEMSTGPEVSKLREDLAGVIQKHRDADAEYALLHADWTAAAAKGDDAAADKLEVEIERKRRQLQRLEVQREALEKELGSAEEVARAARAAKLKETADKLLARSSKRLADMGPLALALAKAIEALEEDLNAWKEARYYAKAEGAEPESFSTQDNDRLVRELVESLGKSRQRTAGIAYELSRVSVFQ